MGLDYAWEKAMVAVTGMACNPDSINERIAHAFAYSLIRISPEEHLPDDLRPLFEDIRAALTSVAPVGDEGSIAATTRVMSTEEATNVARKIVELYDRICAAMPSR